MADLEGSFGRVTLGEFLGRLASDEPVPGGGSASAVAGAMAASLVAMVARLSLGRPKYENFKETNERALAVAESAREKLLTLSDDDARAYATYMDAVRMPKSSDDEQRARSAAMQAAARQATEAPLAVARECVRLIESIASIAGRSNLNAASDLEVAARLCAAAARGAAANVLINLPAVGDQRFAGGTTAELEGVLHAVDREVLQVSQRVGRGALRSPEHA